MKDATWRELLDDRLKAQGETWDDITGTTLLESEYDVIFDNGWGGAEGKPFTVWTKNRVYFPAVYDGSEWVASVSRNPDGIPTNHVGGE